MHYVDLNMMILLHCTLSLAAQCIVIGPVCVFATGGRAFVRGSVTMISPNCVHRFSPNWVCIGDHLQLIKFCPSCPPPGKGSAAGRNFLVPRYDDQRAVFASLRALF